MKKRIFVVIVTVIFAGIIITGCLYAVDMNKMKNNEPVVFSTWGYDYAPIENISEPPVLNLVNSSGDVLASCLTSTYDWFDGKGCIFSDYPHPVDREYGENNILRIVKGTEVLIDNLDFKITEVNLYSTKVSDKLKYYIEHTESSVNIDMPDDEEYTMEIITEHRQGNVRFCVKVVETK